MLAAVWLAAFAALPQIPFQKYRLTNGLTVILSEDHRAPVASVDVWYHVGAANERAGRSGFAHLFEHLMFQGSKHLQGDERVVFSILERNGATNLNGTTEWDRTNYFETMPKDRLELALWLESDRMGFLLETLDQKKLDTQREVVLNERRQSIENVPYARAEEHLVELLYPLPSPYHGYVIGSPEDIRNASLDDVKEFFRTYYTPDNASISIVGDFSVAEMKGLVQKYFAPIPKGSIPRPEIAAPPQAPAKAVSETMRDKVQLAKVLLGFIGPRPLENPAMLPLTLLLSGGKSSRLYHDLVYDKKLAQDVNASFDSSMQLNGFVELTATVQAGRKPEEVIAALSAELKALRDAPPPAEELERVKRNIRASLFAQLENVGGFGGKADLLDEFEFRAHDPGRFTPQLEQILAVTPADIQAAAKTYLLDENRVTITVLPEGAK